MKSTPLTIVCIAADLTSGKLGGAEHHIVETVKRLAKKHKIYLFVGKNTSISQSLPQNITVVAIKYPQIPNLFGLSFIFFGYFQTLSYLKDINFHLIWAKQCFPQAPLAALLKKRFKKPLYITAQNPKLHFEELVVTGPLKALHYLFAALLDPIIAWSIKQANLVAAVSSYSAQLAKNMGSQHTIVIPNGVNPPPKLPPPPKNTTFTIFSASALIPRNGIDILIRATSLLPADLDWQLLIAGDGPEHKNLAAQIKKLQLGSHIKLLGRVSNQDIAKHLKSAHVFCRPSRWEGFGVAFAEAMAHGVPVIATPVGGIPDFITHKHTGLLATPEDPQSVAANIILLYNDKKLYHSIRSTAFHHITKRYTWEKISHQIDTSFHQLTSS